jgi:glycosyltransferase involved in cell wall biosynthesis
MIPAMRVAIVLPDLPRSRFTGGTLCVIEHGNQLVALGHSVALVTLRPPEVPEFATVSAEVRTALPDRRRPPSAGAKQLAAHLVRSRAIRAVSTSPLAYDLASTELRRGIGLERCAHLLPRDADVTLATHSSTVLPALLHGSGVVAQFMQHDDVLTDPSEFATESRVVDSLELPRVANSSWLLQRLRDRGHSTVRVYNAVSSEVFFPRESEKDIGSPPVVVSYGGRGVPWKGFVDAARAIRLLRSRLGAVRWLVYGDAALPAQNDIADFEEIGTVHGASLRELYWQADVVLCPSWYESYPLPPIEAMASGVPVVTTPLGTEDFARNGDTAIVVPAQEPSQMADALASVLSDAKLRNDLRAAGSAEARRHTWTRAGRSMEAALTSLLASRS